MEFNSFAFCFLKTETNAYLNQEKKIYIFINLISIVILSLSSLIALWYFRLSASNNSILELFFLFEFIKA